MKRLSYKELSINALPKYYQERLKAIFDRKTDDSCLITKFSGYTWYLWSIDLPIGRSNE